MAPRLARGKCRNTLRIMMGWLLSTLHPSCWKTAVLLLLLEQNEYLGLLPYLEWAETLESASTHNTQKIPESVSGMDDPRKYLPWGSTLSSQGPRWDWMESSKIWPPAQPKVSNRQGLAPCSISWPKSSERMPHRSSLNMDCVLPFKTAQSIDVMLLHKCHNSILLQNTDGNALPEQTLEVSWG